MITPPSDKQPAKRNEEAHPEPNADELDEILENYALNILDLAIYAQETGQLKPIAEVTKIRLEVRSKLQSRDRAHALAILEEVEKAIGPGRPLDLEASTGIEVSHNLFLNGQNKLRAELRTAIARLKDKYGGHDV